VDQRTLCVRFLPLHQTIHVYRDSHGVLRTDHTFRYWGLRFLSLHYKIVPKPLRP